MLNILFIIGLVLLSLNTLRFILGNYTIIKSKEFNWYLKIWNVLESIGISVVLVILILNYYN